MHGCRASWASSMAGQLVGCVWLIAWRVGCPASHAQDVPRIEVTYHLSADMFLTAEARDLDTQRHKKWLQRGEIIVLKQ